MEEHLRENGVAAEQIVSMNFESMQYADMDSKALYQAVMERKLAGKRLYLFFDEVQKVPQWQNAVNSFRIDLDCDIYVTGSNAFLLSSELSTYLSGRYVEVKMLPLSFAEFLDFQGYTVESYQSPAGGQRKRAIDKQGQMMDLRELFQAYIRFGGMPAISETGLDQKKGPYAAGWHLLCCGSAGHPGARPPEGTAGHYRRTAFAEDHPLSVRQHWEQHLDPLHRQHACDGGPPGGGEP